MKISPSMFSNLSEILLRTQAVKATKFYSDNFIVRAKRKTFRGRINKRSNIEIIFTLGRPNFEERKFIRQCVKAKEPFPIKKVQLKFQKELV